MKRTRDAGWILVWLVIIAALNSVISAYYYISVIVAMYMEQGGAEDVRMRGRPALFATVAIAVVGVLLIGLYPQPFIAAATNAFASATGVPPIHAASLVP